MADKQEKDLAREDTANKIEEILEKAADKANIEETRDTKNIVELEHQKNSKQKDRINSYVHTANAKILLNTLAPEVSKNESKKREHKDKLIKYVSIFLGAQFLIIFILILLLIISIIVFHALEKDLSFDTIKMLFAFFSTYITSVIVELIYILKHIVDNVFDTSISALMEVFKTQKKEE